MKAMRLNCRCSLLLPLFAAVVCGCHHIRMAARADVPGPSHMITTRNRYRVTWKSYGQEVDRTELLKQYQPNVFAQDGIPITVTVTDRKVNTFACSDGVELVQLLGYVCSCGILPLQFNSEETSETVDIRLSPALSRPVANVSVGHQVDRAMALWPIAYCIYPGKTSYPQSRETTVWGRHAYGSMFHGGGDFFDTRMLWAYEAWAYGIGSKLRDLEASGVITPGMVEQHRVEKHKADVVKRLDSEKVKREKEVMRLLQKTTDPQQHQVPYRLVFLEREENCDFAYRFALELNGEPSVQTFFGVQNVFVDEVRTAYQLEFPNADVTSLRIVVRPQLINGKIEGRAVVLTITPVSLVYDPLTRKGRISVKFDENQYAEAREWARKNIETLVRDKNIVIETGELPPPGRYLSGHERIVDTSHGKVLEMEFKAE